VNTGRSEACAIEKEKKFVSDSKKQGIQTKASGEEKITTDLKRSGRGTPSEEDGYAVQ